MLKINKTEIINIQSFQAASMRVGCFISKYTAFTIIDFLLHLSKSYCFCLLSFIFIYNRQWRSQGKEGGWEMIGTREFFGNFMSNWKSFTLQQWMKKWGGRWRIDELSIQNLPPKEKTIKFNKRLPYYQIKVVLQRRMNNMNYSRRETRRIWI